MLINYRYKHENSSSHCHADPPVLNDFNILIPYISTDLFIMVCVISIVVFSESLLFTLFMCLFLCFNSDSGHFPVAQ